MVAHIPPRFLYRYRPAGTSYFAEELRRAVENREIYLSKINSVNDPFEASPVLTANAIKEVRQYLSDFEIVFGKGIALSGTDFNKIANQHGIAKSKVRKFVGPSLEGARNTVSLLEGALEDVRSRIRIACLSERWESLLMWGHYGQSHRGVCIEYEVKIDVGAKARVAPVSVDYVIQRPTVTYLELMEYFASARNAERPEFFNAERVARTFDSIALTKPKDWEYEREWRIMDVSDSAAGYFRVASLEPKSILLGANHSQEVLEIVRSVAAGRVVIEVVSLDNRQFALRRRALGA